MATPLPVPRHALGRIAMSAVFGFGTYLAAARQLTPQTSALLGWDIAGVVLLALTWAIVGSSDAHLTRERAGAEDPGRSLVYAIVLVTSGVSLLAATLLVRDARDLAPGPKHGMAILCLATVALAWTMTHTAFTFRYAHLYYREDKEGVGGVEFQGGDPPTYFDFAYFAFTVGMCFQVSDACVSSPQIRRAVLLQAVISFAYNTIILAFVLNLVFGMAT